MRLIILKLKERAYCKSDCGINVKHPTPKSDQQIGQFKTDGEYYFFANKTLYIFYEIQNFGRDYLSHMEVSMSST